MAKMRHFPMSCRHTLRLFGEIAMRSDEAAIAVMDDDPGVVAKPGEAARDGAGLGLRATAGKEHQGLHLIAADPPAASHRLNDDEVIVSHPPSPASRATGDITRLRRVRASLSLEAA